MANITKKVLAEHNLFMSENLKFLKHNAHAYAGAVDFVYIDPTSEVPLSHRPPVMPTKEPKSKNDLLKDKHKVWAEYMKERFVRVLPFMKEEGVIAVTIDDVELPRLRTVMDDVFGEDNFIGMVIVESGNVHNNARFLSISHEYLLVYAKNMKQLTKSNIRWRQPREGLSVLRKKEEQLRKEFGDDYSRISEELKVWLKDQPLTKRLKQFFNADAKGLYSYSDLSAPGVSLRYEILHPVTGNPVVLPKRGWGLTEDNFNQLAEQELIIWGDTEMQQPMKKFYLKDTPDQVIRGVMHYPARTPTQMLKRILGAEKTFENPKNLDFMKYLIETMSPENAVVLDFFAGSGTTGHAVLDLNYENPETSRSFILVTEEDAKKTFTKVLKPRIEAVISGNWADRQHRPRKAVLHVK